MGYLCSDFHIERNFFFSINKHESNYETITEWFFTLYTMSCLSNKKNVKENIAMQLNSTYSITSNK